MAQSKTSANSTSTVAELQQFYNEHKDFFDKQNHVLQLRDIQQVYAPKRIPTIDKAELKSLIQNIGGSEVRLRNTARYLFYRSNVFFRIVYWYATMFDLKCRQVIPKYDLTKAQNNDAMLKSYNKTLDVLEIMNLHDNMTEALINVFAQDVYFAIRYMDKTGMFFFPLDPDECIIDGRYSTGDFSFAVDMSKWNNKRRQQVIDYVGSPLKEMFEEYQRTKVRYIHVPDKYAFCLKFRTDTWDTVVPPLLPTFLQMAGLEDLVDIQAEKDELSIYKLIYMPMPVLSGAKQPDEFEVTPDISLRYLQKMIDRGSVPPNVAVGAIPGEGLKVIDFERDATDDTNNVEKASNQILQTAGGGAVINASNITSTAAFNAWLKSETEFAISTLLPQIAGFTNRVLNYELGKNACKVKYFEVSVYTKDSLAEQLLTSCQYSFSNRLAYNTLLGISEKDTLAMIYFETEVLKLQDIMKYPLQSSYTASGEVGQGAPTKDDDDLTESGERARNS